MSHGSRGNCGLLHKQRGADEALSAHCGLAFSQAFSQDVKQYLEDLS